MMRKPTVISLMVSMVLALSACGGQRERNADIPAKEEVKPTRKTRWGSEA